MNCRLPRTRMSNTSPSWSTAVLIFREALNKYREAVTSFSPGLPEATLGFGELKPNQPRRGCASVRASDPEKATTPPCLNDYGATPLGLSDFWKLCTQGSLRQPWAEGRNRFAVLNQSFPKIKNLWTVILRNDEKT